MLDSPTMSRVRRSETRRAAGAPEVLPDLLLRGVRRWPEHVVMRQKEFGIWREVRWRNWLVDVREIAMGLVAQGFQPGDVASILSNTKREWVSCDFAILSAGGVCAGIYPTASAPQVAYQLRDPRSRFVFVEDEEQLDKVLSVRSDLPDLKRIVVFDTKGLRGFDDEGVMSLRDLRGIGCAYHADNPGIWDQRLSSRRSEDLAVLIYTSGTTGQPKGAMLSHGNMMSSLEPMLDKFPQGPGDERMCFLPLCHVAERLTGELLPLYSGATINLVENPDTAPIDIREISPTVMFGVPRLWEKFHSAVSIRISEATRIGRWAYKLALHLGERVARRQEEGRDASAPLRLASRVARKLVLGNVRRWIGLDRCRILVSGAAPISPNLIRWYRALGFGMVEVYGLTEGCLVSATEAGQGRPGTVGEVLDYNEVRLSPEGEILVRGPNVFMGYLNLPDKTAESIEKGWLRTGDVGELEVDGTLRITDRLKDVIVTAGGKNITPSELESELKFSPFISDAMIVGDRRKYLTAIVMIDQENTEKHAQDRGIEFSDFGSLCRARAIKDLIWAEIERVNEGFSRVEQVKKFRLIEHLLTPEDDELTPTMKLKRKFVTEKYGDLIEDMYREAP